MKAKRNYFRRKLLNPRFLIVISTILFSLFTYFIPPIQTWVATNMTPLENVENETKMPAPVFIVFCILVVGGIVYLVYDSLKESDTDRIEKKLDKLIELMEKRKNGDEAKPKPKANK